VLVLAVFPEKENQTCERWQQRKIKTQTLTQGKESPADRSKLNWIWILTEYMSVFNDL
jgi:hypothetical protein